MTLQSVQWHWAGALIGLCIATLAAAPLRANAQETPPAPPAQETPVATPGADTPADMRQPPGTPRGAAQPQSRRRAADNDQPPSAFELLTGSPAVTQAANEPPHPLAAAHPDHHIIVCVAGCNQTGPGIVYMAPRATSNVNQAPATLASAVSGAGEPGAIAAADSVIQCVAGCYSGVKSYRMPAAGASKIREKSARMSVPTSYEAVIAARPHKKKPRYRGQ